MTHASIGSLYTQRWSGGQGLPVVLSHALGLDHTIWLNPLHPDKPSAGYGPVLAYDHRGHGGSHCPPGPYSQDDLLADAIELIEAWGHGPVVWVGLSLGGMVGQGLAIRRPDLVRGLVLAHTSAQYPPQAKAAWDARIQAVRNGGMAAVADTVVARYLSEPFRRQHPQVAIELRDQLLRADAVGYVACCHAVVQVNWLDELHQISCPTVVLAGAHDAGAPPEMARAIAQRIPGAQLQVFSDSAHLSPTEEPTAFRSAVQAFIQTLATP